MRELTEEDLEWIAEGAAVLGTGGGGNTYLARLDVRRLVRQGARVRMASIDEVADAAFGPVIGGMGAPTVGIERLPIAGRFGQLVRAAGEALGRAPAFVAIGEIGGANAIRPLSAAAETDLPVLDCDPMGRAFPELQMSTYMIHGLAPRPMILNDGKGVLAVLRQVPDSRTAERYGRALTWAMGGSTGLALSVITGAQAREHGIAGTLSLTLRIGQAMARARDEKRPTTEAIVEQVAGARHLFEGKVVDVSRRTTAGFARGRVRIDGLGEHRGERLVVDFQNEYLIARHADQSERAVLTVPDLLVLVESESGRALGSEMVRYGLRVQVLGLPAPHELRTEAALRVVGPAAFGYEDSYAPIPGDLLGRVAPIAS